MEAIARRYMNFARGVSVAGNCAVSDGRNCMLVLSDSTVSLLTHKRREDGVGGCRCVLGAAVDAKDNIRRDSETMRHTLLNMHNGRQGGVCCLRRTSSRGEGSLALCALRCRPAVVVGEPTERYVLRKLPTGH